MFVKNIWRESRQWHRNETGPCQQWYEKWRRMAHGCNGKSPQVQVISGECVWFESTPEVQRRKAECRRTWS